MLRESKPKTVKTATLPTAKVAEVQPKVEAQPKVEPKKVLVEVPVETPAEVDVKAVSEEVAKELIYNMSMKRTELVNIAKSHGLKIVNRMTKQDIIDALDIINV